MKKITDRYKLDFFLSFNEDYKAYSKHILAKGLLFFFNKEGELLTVRKATQRAIEDIEKREVKELRKKEGKNVN